MGLIVFGLCLALAIFATGTVQAIGAIGAILCVGFFLGLLSEI